MSDSLRPHESQHARPPCPTPTPGVHPDLRPSIQWCHPAISSSVIPFSSCPQSLQASGSFHITQLFASGDQSIRASDSASVSPMNTQDWFPLGLTGSISLQAKGLSRVFYNTTVQKHQHFGAQPSLWSNSHIQKTQWKLKYTLTLLLNNVVPYTIPVSSASFLNCLILLTERSCPLLPLLRNQSIWELCLWTSPGRAAMYRSSGCSLEKSIQVKEPLRAKIYFSFHSGD